MYLASNNLPSIANLLRSSLRFLSRCLVLMGFVAAVHAVVEVPAAEAMEPDWSLYAGLLHDHVQAGEKDGLQANIVNYEALRADPRLARLKAQLAAFPIHSLTSQNEKIAFYINAYNLLAMAMVADHWPLSRLKDLGSVFNPVWKLPAGELGGQAVTLSYLEQQVLRKFGEPRVHMAINCASMSCPDLRAEPYTAARLDEQLKDQSFRFLQQQNKGIVIEGDRVYLSRIFKWFDEDFEAVGGVTAFVKNHCPDFPQNAVVKDFLPYNWDVNAHLNALDRRQIRQASLF